MSTYRVKADSGRVLGPFSKEQIASAYLKGLINGGEKFQKFPSGDWAQLSKFEDLNKYLLEIMGNSSSPKVKIDDLNYTKTMAFKDVEKEKIIEFEYKKKEVTKIDYDELEKNFQRRKSDNKKSIDKTVIVNIASLKDHDKTIMLNNPPVVETVKEVVEEDLVELEDDLENEEVDISSDKTEMISLSKHLPLLRKEYHDSEKQQLEATQAAMPKDNTEVFVEEVEKKENKKTKPIVALAFIVLFYFILFDDEETKAPKVVRTKIEFPVIEDILDEKLSTKLYNEGLKHYSKNTYMSKVYAANAFKKSLEKSFKGNKSLGMLLRTYAELYKNSSNFKKSSIVINKMSKIARSKVLTDLNVAYGTALFYLELKKFKAAAHTIERYLRIGKADLSILSLYSDILLKIGDVIKARKVITTIEKAKFFTKQSYISRVNYYSFNEENEKSAKILREALNQYSDDVELILLYSRTMFAMGDYKNFKISMKNLVNTNMNGSPFLYSQWLELLGILSVYKNDLKKAAKLFRTSLKVHDNENLRIMLSNIEIGGDSITEQLISESKSLKFIKKSKEYKKEKKWEKAFKEAMRPSNSR